MKILIACEYSGIVRDAFIKKGHDAISCDLLPTEKAGPHYQGDVFDIINDGFDLMIAHPPCTYLSYSGTVAWDNPGRIKKRLDALEFFRRLWEASIDKICIENPKSCASPVIAKYTQEIQPYYFGDSDMKTTWLWLKNLNQLIHIEENELFETITHVAKPEPIYISPKGKKEYFTTARNHANQLRAKSRAQTFPGIADAMAEQWGNE